MVDINIRQKWLANFIGLIPKFLNKFGFKLSKSFFARSEQTKAVAKLAQSYNSINKELRNVLGSSLGSIEDPEIAKHYKEECKQILQNPNFSKEERELLIRNRLLKIGEYLEEVKAKKLANLSAIGKQLDQVAAIKAKTLNSEDHSQRGQLEQRMLAFFEEFTKQNRVFSPATAFDSQTAETTKTKQNFLTMFAQQSQENLQQFTDTVLAVKPRVAAAPEKQEAPEVLDAAQETLPMPIRMVK